MIQPIILAAGKGTRMQSALPKTLHKVAGNSLVRWILDAFAAVPGYTQPIVVVGYGADEVAAVVAPCKTVLQEEINGSASAVATALPQVTEAAVLVVNGDHPFISATSLNFIAHLQAQEPAALIWGTVILPDFKDWRASFVHYGRIVRRGERLERVVEYKNASDAERSVTEVNPNVICVGTAWLRDALSQIKKNEVTGEYYITDLLAIAHKERKSIRTVPLSPVEGYGINTPDDLAQAELLSQELG